MGKQNIVERLQTWIIFGFKLKSALIGYMTLARLCFSASVSSSIKCKQNYLSWRFVVKKKYGKI